MSDNLGEKLEVLSEVLTVTREQLTRSMNVTAELEALLNIERARNEKLQAELEKLNSGASKNDSADKK
jgi:hypothetical protein